MEKQLVINGMNKAVDIIKSTMGANGKLVAYKKDNTTYFTKDGVTVAKHIKFDNPYENIGAEIVISAANETVNRVGDGTTVTSVLVQSFLNTFQKYCTLYNINTLIDIIDEDVEKIIEHLNNNTIKVEDTERVKHIATISSNSSKLGELIKEIYDNVGLDSLISLERSEDTKTTYEISKGLQFESGLVHSEFKNNTTSCVLHNANVIISTEGINNINPYKEIFSKAIENDLPILLIAPEFSQSFIRACILNKQNAGLNICLVRTPGFGGGQDKNIEDIRAFLSEDDTLEKVVVTEQYLTIYNTDTPYLKNRVNKLKQLYEGAENGHDSMDYYSRMYRLQGNTAIVYAGGVTEQSMQEEYDRLEDALYAVKAAIRGGYTIGGGYSLYYLSQTSPIISDIVKEVLTKPVETIISNSNLNPELILDKCYPTQYNVKTRNFEDFLEEGIIDPTEVLTNAISNSWAAVKLIVNTSNILLNVKN